MNGIFDSHAHYDDERFDADRDELLESIHREGVEYIMTIGADLPTSYAARELAERYDFVYFAAGIHPEQAGTPPKLFGRAESSGCPPQVPGHRRDRPGLLLGGKSAEGAANGAVPAAGAAGQGAGPASHHPR